MYPSSINQNAEMNAQYREMQRTMLPTTQETLNRYIQNDVLQGFWEFCSS